MAPITCKVHQLGRDDSDKKVVRIRAAAFKAFQGRRFIIRITSKKGSKSKFACFEAEYVDPTYRDNISGNDLVFMRETWRNLLEVQPFDQVEVEAIPANDSLYEVRSALSEDRNEGRIYIFNEELYDQIAGKRYIARVKRNNKENTKAVYCEIVYADDWYLEDWQEIWKRRGTSPSDFCKLIFISEWYRNLLGIKTIRGKIDLNVKVLNAEPRSLGARIWEWVWEKWALLYLYPRKHPQAAVRTANMMGFIALGLGVIGTGLGFLGIMLWLATIIICLVGFAIAVLGFVGLSIGR